MSPLIIKTPGSYLAERKYIMNLIIKQWLGLEYEHQIWEKTYLQITENNGKKLSLNIVDTFFQTPEELWLTAKSLPVRPLCLMKMDNGLEGIPLTSDIIPIIFGNEVLFENMPNGTWQQVQPYLWTFENKFCLGVDIFGSAFFMLTRYEEYVNPERDKHDRYPAKASLAYQEGFLDRPIINEYLEIFWYCLKRIWPRLERKKRNFRIIVSHDVDVPFAQVFTGISRLIRNCGGDILRRKDLIMAIQRIRSWHAIRNGDYKKDLNYTFDHIMDISEQNNIKSAFYFKTACTNSSYDNNYPIDHPYIRQLMREIYERGHEIGFHSSYSAYNDLAQTCKEYERLRVVCEKEGINQDQWGGRQHYLRWQVPITWHNWTEAGLNYDSTLSYADQAGFRCGVCYEYPVYDLIERIQLPLIERPLIVMEGSILGKQYMNLKGWQARDTMHKLKAYCRKFNGDFTLLWHNSSFEMAANWDIYEEILNYKMT